MKDGDLRSLSDGFLLRLQQMDTSTYVRQVPHVTSPVLVLLTFSCASPRMSEEQQTLIHEYFRTSIYVDAEQARSGNTNLPGLKKLTTAICKNLSR